MREWCSKRSLHVPPEDICESAILQHISSHVDSVRLRGIAACDLLAEERARQGVGYTHAEGGEKEVVDGLEKLLDDESICVHIPAAMALLCLGREHEKVRPHSSSWHIGTNQLHFHPV